ncbi:hypothetical protein ABNF65_02805 [Paenibacillus larvae]
MSKRNYATDKTVTLQGKEFVLFEGLLEVAHRDYKLSGVMTDILQLPNVENEMQAVVKAVITTEDGRTFTGLGDADPKNVNKMVSKHLIRMAETRAIGRALRFLTGYGTLAEELGGDDSSEERDKLVSEIRAFSFDLGEIADKKISELESKAKMKLEKMPITYLHKAKIILNNLAEEQKAS